MASAENVLVAGLEAENVAEIERPDLAAAVVEHLGGANRSADDLVEVIGGLALAVDFGVAGKRHRGSHHLDRAAGSARHHRRAAGVPRAIMGLAEAAWIVVCVSIGRLLLLPR